MKPKSTLRSFLLLAGSTLLAISYSHAATLTWDANGATALQTDGAGAWLDADKWWTGSANTTWTSTDSAIFGNGGAGGAVTLASPTTVGSLTFNYFTGTYTLGTAAQTITLNSGITKNAGAGAVTFQGASPITLGAAQTFTNNSATTLTIGALDLNTFALTVGGTGTTSFDGNVANVLSGAGGIIKNGTGSLILDGGTSITHTFSGGITVNGGFVFFQNATNVSGRGNVTLNDGYLEGRFNSSPTFAGGLGAGTTAIQILGGTSGFSGQGGTSSTFRIGTALSVLKWGALGENGATGFFNPTVFVASTSTNTNAKGSLNNGIDLNGTTRTITNLHTTGDGATSTGFTISGGIVNTAGSAAGLIKTGPGAIILGAANTYDGSTSIQGGSIILSAAAATINSTTSLGLSGGGTLRLVNTAQVNRFADGAAITVSSGGGISYENTNTAAITYTETLGAATVSGGLLNVVQSTNQATSNGQTLTFGGLSQSGTGSVAFSAGGTGPQATGLKNMIVVTGGSTTAANEIIGPWATTGTTAALQTDYAVYNADFVVPAAIASSVESTWSTTHAATSNYTLVHVAGSALDGRLTATRNINSLRANSATNAIASVDDPNDTFTVTGSTFADGDVITFGGTAPAGLVTGQPYYVVSASGDTFGVAATSGGTKINLTTLGTSNITAGITLSTGNNLGTFGILNAQGSALVIGRSGTGVVTLPTTSAGNLYVTAGGGSATSIGVPIADNTGALTLVKGGASTVRLYSANTYTGDTIINSGILQIGVNGLTNGANLGSGTYAGNIFIGSGASLDFQTNSNQTLSGVISGDGALLKRYIGTLTLSGANTYTGKTTIGALTNSGDPTLVVSSFNSVSTPVASSSLGRPTTVANGTIEMGSNNSSPNPTIRYNGTGEITDRVINFVFNSAATRTLDASGASGLLKFTSAFTSNGTTTSHLVLKGTGAGEITQGLPFGFTNLTKSDAGTWTLGGSIGNTGLTTVSAGTLIINGNQPSATGAFAVNGTSTLGGSGTVSGAVTVAAGANLTPGTSVGTLTMKSTLNISASAGGTGKLNFELGSIAASDKIVVGGTLTIGAGTLNFADFNFTALGGLQNGTYKLITSGAAVSGTLDPAGGVLTGTVGAGSGTLQISGGGTGNDIELVVTGVGGGPGPVDHFVISAISSPQTVGTPITGITITAEDSLNATATGFTGTVTFGGTGGFSGTSGTFVLGVLSGVSVTPSVAGSNLTFTVDDDSGPSVGSTTITTIQTQYQAWAGGALFDQDANGDGVKNGLAFLLGASGPNVAVTLPTVTQSGGNLVLSNFSSRNLASRGTATLSVQHSSDLGIGDPWTTVLVPEATAAEVSGVSYNITSGNPLNTVNTATISVSQSAAGKLFGRLKANNP